MEREFTDGGMEAMNDRVNQIREIMAEPDDNIHPTSVYKGYPGHSTRFQRMKERILCLDFEPRSIVVRTGHFEMVLTIGGPTVYFEIYQTKVNFYWHWAMEEYRIRLNKEDAKVIQEACWYIRRNPSMFQ